MPRRVRSRRRRRSDQHRLNASGDSESSSFLEVSHDHGHHHRHNHDHDRHHYHNHHHHNHSRHEDEHYPQDGIHNIDHHHVHVQDRQLHTPKQLTYVHEPLQKQAEIRYGNLQENGGTYINTQEHQITRADILFDEMQKEEARRLDAMKEKTKKRVVTTNETTTTTVRRGLKEGTTTEGAGVGMNGGVSPSLAETLKNTVLGLITPQEKDKSLPSIIESSESGFEDGLLIGDQRELSTPNQPFRPAREFFDEADARERLTSGYCSESDTPSKLRESTRRLSIRKPYNQYIAYSSDEEYDEWKGQPKSDYTYSASLTYRERVTPDRKIGSPNMSRRGLQGGTSSYVRTEFSSGGEDTNTWNLRSRSIYKPMDALSDTSDGEEQQHVELQRRNRRSSSRSQSIDLPQSNGGVTRTITTMSTEYQTTRTLHRGLDTESDVDDVTESAVPTRAVPLLARGGTPLGRAITPLPTLKLTASRRSSSAAATDYYKTYKTGEGTIAEDLEEDEAPEELNIITRWSRQTIHCVTRITTIVTASIAMMAARAVTASSVSSTSSSKGKALDGESSTSYFTYSAVKSKYNGFCEYLAKRPILLWIPLLVLLLLLALGAYWLTSHGQTAGASAPTETEGTPFFLALSRPVFNLASWVYSGIASSLAALWVTTTSTCVWILSGIQTGVVYMVESVVAISVGLGTSTITFLSWLWSLVVSCFSFLLHLLYLGWEYASYGALGVYGFFSSSSSYIYGLLPFTSNDNETNVKQDSFSLIASLSNISPTEYLSQAYMAVAEGMQSSGTILWNAWLWLVLSIGEILSAMASYTLWGFSSLWGALIWGFSSLWGAVISFGKGLWALFATLLWTPASFLLSLGANRSTTRVTTSTEKTVVVPPVIVSQTFPKMDEIVQQVLDSDGLKSVIAAAIAQNSEGQLTIESVEASAKVWIEKELGVVKEEMSVLRTEVHTNAAASAEQYSTIVQLNQHKADLINQLAKLGQRLYNVEGKIEVSDAKMLDSNQEIEGKIEELVQQFNMLEKDHAGLAADVKTCCDGQKIPVLLGNIFGIPPDEMPGGEAQPDIGSWLKNYFVAKDELTAKLNGIIATMQVRPDDDATQAAVSQTRDIVMAAVLEKLREERGKEQLQLSEQVKTVVGEQVSQQVSQQVQMQMQSQSQQLHEKMKENVNMAVQEHIGPAVEIAVNEAVDMAVPLAVEKSAPEIVRGMVSSEIKTSVPEVVASVLPATVNAAISEAMVHINEKQENDQNLQGDGRTNVVGVTGSASVNVSHETGDGSHFVGGMHYTGGLNETEVWKIVQDALRTYDADKTGMVDHALESAGGNIVSTRCTENYQVHQAEVRVLGIPIYRYSTNNPRTVIQPDTMPGQCWAFKGSQGYIVIQLSGMIKPTGFTLEHIPKSLSPTGTIDSAPREFEVWGLFSENDEGVMLGTFEYVEDGEPLQYYPVAVNNSEHFPLIELKINSNHGNLHYTCLYRFRVHGLRLS